MTKRLLQQTMRMVTCLCILLSSAVYGQTVRLILAADMPDISSPDSGKYAELNTLLNQYRQKDETVFFVFGGGSIGPSAMSVFDRGAHIIDILNSLEPDVMTVTKREFSYFEDELSLRAYEAAFPIVTSNVIDNRFGIPPDGLVKNAIIEKNGYKLGIISILNERIIDEYLLQKIRVLDPMEITRNYAGSLREKGADIVLLHYSYPFQFVAEMLKDGVIDIGFMSDTRLLEKNQTIAEHPNNFLLGRPGTAIVAELQIQAGSPPITRYEEVTLSTVTTHTSTQLQVDSYQLRLNRLLDERIGFWGTDISTRRPDVRGKENNFANFIVDTMREYAESDVALINGGSIRGDTNYVAETPITRRDIATELPFRSTLSRIKVTGEQLKQALETGLSQVEYLKGSFPHVSGLTFSYNSSAPSGQRLTNTLIDGAPLQNDQTYTLATSNYLANGGDGYTSLTQGTNDDPARTISILVSDLVIQNIRLRGGVNSRVENRIQDEAR